MANASIENRLRKLEQVTKPIACIWGDQQSDAELQAEIAEREAKGLEVHVVSWER